VSEVGFPVLGVMFIMVVALPLLALAAKALLALLERDEVGGALHGFEGRFLVLAGSSLLPLAWFVSAAVHQAESGESVMACLLSHDVAELCVEPGLFAALLLIVVAACSRATLRGRVVTTSTSPAAQATKGRLDDLTSTRGELALLQGRTLVTDEPGFSLGTQGLMLPRVIVGARFAAGLSDDALAGALAHEAEHVRGRDPFRYLLLQLALAANPFGRWLLQVHADRWVAAREAHCDREAVLRGAAPLPLAEAIIRAARPESRPLVALGPRTAAMVWFRVQLLVAFSERPPSHCCEGAGSVVPAAAVMLALALALPHQTGTAALDALHTGAEHALTFLWE